MESVCYLWGWYEKWWILGLLEQNGENHQRGQRELCETNSSGADSDNSGLDFFVSSNLKTTI